MTFYSMDAVLLVHCNKHCEKQIGKGTRMLLHAVGMVMQMPQCRLVHALQCIAMCSAVGRWQKRT